ncbi:MAG: ABC transporter permease, partial [Candidatus Pelagibacter ubique]
KTEILTILRDKKALILICSFPIVFALLYGLVLGAFGSTNKKIYLNSLSSTLTTMIVFTCINGSAGSIARSRENKLFSRLCFTNINYMVIMLGKIIYFLLITLIQTILLDIISIIFFDMTLLMAIQVIGMAVLFAFFSLSLGILIANITDTEDGAEHATVLISFVFLILGAWYPISSMSGIVKKIVKVNPVYYFVDSINNIVGSNNDLAIYINIIILVGISAVMFTLSNLTFKRGNI